MRAQRDAEADNRPSAQGPALRLLGRHANGIDDGFDARSQDHAPGLECQTIRFWTRPRRDELRMPGFKSGRFTAVPSSVRSRGMQQGVGEFLALPFAFMQTTVDEKGGGPLHPA